jgi:hypothetical protein
MIVGNSLNLPFAQGAQLPFLSAVKIKEAGDGQELHI